MLLFFLQIFTMMVMIRMMMKIIRMRRRMMLMMMMMMMMRRRRRRILVTRVLHFFSPNIYIFDPTSASTQGISLGKQWCQNVDQPSSSQQRFHIIIISRYLNKKFRTNWLEWQLEAYWQYSLGTSEKKRANANNWLSAKQYVTPSPWTQRNTLRNILRNIQDNFEKCLRSFWEIS